MKPRSAWIAAVLAICTAVGAVNTASAQTILDKVKQAGVVRIGTGNDTPPMNYLDDAGKWTGFDVDLGDEIGKRLGVKVERASPSTIRHGSPSSRTARSTWRCPTSVGH